jgi:hypothetical protein
LDHELLQRGWAEVDFLKIDAEGYDFNVLLGATQLLARQAVKIIQFEYNASWAAAGATLTRARRWLASNGYHVYALCKSRLANLDPKAGEYFRYSNYVALSKAGEELVATELPR